MCDRQLFWLIALLCHLTHHKPQTRINSTAWASRFIARETVPAASGEHAAIRIAETGGGKFQNYVIAGRHRIFADEPTDVGGLDSGPTPYEFLSVSLAACTSMTLRMYAAFKKIDVGTIAVEVFHDRVHAKDCADCAQELRERPGRIDRFERRVTVAGDIDAALAAKLLEIADKCPVHRTLEAGAAVVTRIVGE